MASFERTFSEVSQIRKLAEAAGDNNYDGAVDFGEQADILAEIRDLATSAAKAFAAANKALGG